MSNGDDENAEDADASEETALDADTLESRLDDVESAIEAAETEADLDDAEADLDSVEADVEAADLPEPDDEDEESREEQLTSRIEELRATLEDERGPYAEDVQETLDEAATKLRETRWTEAGGPDAKAAAETFLDAAGEELDADFAAASDELDDLAAALEGVGETIVDGGSAVEGGLDPDEDDETIAALLEAADELETGLDDAEEWSDLTVVEQLRVEGFYDRMNAENRKDFPPELTVVRLAEAENDPERIVQALEKFESDFMEENCIDALRRLGAEEAFDIMHERAQKRSRPEIEVLGKIGDERAVETLVEFANSDNPPLQKVTLRALGEIGSEEATQAVANALDDDESVIRSQAARALGLIGDTRAIAPLSDVLDDDDEETEVRASAAWALVQIGTERALEAAAEYDDDRAYTVQVEAEKARDATAV
ncbi:HEAT repeat domain-containing protein [Natronomonas sp.]|uniref:HEAT repeat domain-containing protein n=1 Tax=Natronomonas sp. TaxID=2184060 RepID=UPI002FC2D915